MPGSVPGCWNAATVARKGVLTKRCGWTKLVCISDQAKHVKEKIQACNRDKNNGKEQFHKFSHTYRSTISGTQYKWI